MTTRLQNLKRKTFAKYWIRKFSFVYKNNIKIKEVAGLFNTLKMPINTSDAQAQEHGGHCEKKS